MIIPGTIALFAALSLVDSVPAAAPSARASVTYGFVAAHDQVREELLAPLRWGGAGGGVHAAWRREAGAGRHTLSLTAPATVLSNRFGDEGIGLSPRVEYSYVREVAGVRPLGGTLRAGVQAGWSMYAGYYGSWDEEHAYWLTATSLGPRVEWSRQVARGTSLEGAVSVPALALVSRPPLHRRNKIDDLTRPLFYLFGTHRDARLAAFPDLAALRAEVAVERGTGRTRLVVGYELESVSHDRPDAIRRLAGRLVVARRVAIGGGR